MDYTHTQRSAASIDVVSETFAHPKAINLELVCLEFNNTFTIARVGEFSVGDVVVYLHAGAIMPADSGWDKSGTVEKYLRKDRSIQVVTLCGIPSGGVAFNVQDVLGDVQEQIAVPCDISDRIGVVGEASKTYYEASFRLRNALELEESDLTKRQGFLSSKTVFVTAGVAFAAGLLFYVLRTSKSMQ